MSDALDMSGGGSVVSDTTERPFFLLFTLTTQGDRRTKIWF